VEEPETCYHQRLEASRPTGFYRDALRTYAGMLSLLAWQELPVVTDDNLVEGRVAPNRLTAPEGVS
jgi:hypothetical protein